MLTHALTWINPEDIMESEISQSHMHNFFFFFCSDGEQTQGLVHARPRLYLQTSYFYMRYVGVFKIRKTKKYNGGYQRLGEEKGRLGI
jgi:hypothetical protein